MDILAQDYVIVAESPDKNSIYAGSPCLAELPTGELVASYEWFGPSPKKETIPNQTEVKVSADGVTHGRCVGKRTLSGLVFLSTAMPCI